ncbi:MAG: DUF1206 domain-containing protein [Actinomycetota bacterium]|nr:DUF1206 domain-containing protein [Actinomycetota bacterium]
MNGSGRASAAVGKARRSGQRVEASTSFGVLVTIGLLAYGVVHLLIAWIAVQLAWSGGGQQASQSGAFHEMASTSIGSVLLWVTAVGLFALTLWQLFEAGWGHHEAQGRARVGRRLASAGRAVVYLALGISAVSTAAGSSKSNSNAGEKTLTAKLLSVTFGRLLVVVVGVVVVVVGGQLVYRGVTKKFTRDLEGGAGAGVVRLGQIGYVAKGIAMAIVGVLFVVAAITFDPQKAGGMDTALRTLRDEPFGPILLTVMALGIACFGLYCFAWSRRAKKA